MKKKKRVIVLAFLLAILTLFSSCSLLQSNFPFQGEVLLYYRNLIEQGFPADYAASLTELHLLHPAWTFEALSISATNQDYTWERVIEEETANPETNLVSGALSFKSYRHQTNETLYDSGYYQASEEAVSYFMDPRNFLNEADIFQFYNLSDSYGGTLEGVQNVLSGTFMESAKLENGLTYAAYFMEVGSSLGINPVYLAVKARQEQGVSGTSPVLSGVCGSKLIEFYDNGTTKTENGSDVLLPATIDREQLLSLNGYYNLYNVGAGGNGVFAIYQKAMEAAKAGTPAMAAQWGGNASWNSIWKSIYGGAYQIKTKYVDAYQSTIYLQKFNVDGRSGKNFYFQYMQNVAAALTEAQSLYSSFVSVGALDEACSFIVPVYDGMPANACPDPSDSACLLFAASNTRYSYSAAFTSPIEAGETDRPVYLQTRIGKGSTLTLSGSVSHSNSVAGIEYSLDNGEWQALPYGSDFDFSLPMDYPAGSTHILVLRGKAGLSNDSSSQKSNDRFLISVIYITVTLPILKRT